MTKVTIEKKISKNENYLIYSGLSIGDLVESKIDNKLTEKEQYLVEYTYGNEGFIKDDNGNMVSVTPDAFNLVYTKNEINIKKNAN